MTVRIVHKNSEAEDKRPTAGQLAKGEIAVNLHEAGAFLSIKDTAGNIQQVGGVKVAQNSPANPVKGTFWLDADNNTLFIYDGTQWRGVTGGGGGGSGINLAEGDAIDITQAGSTYTINVVAGAGITLAGDNVAVELDTDATTVGLKMVGAGDAGKLSAKVATASTLGAVKVDDTTIKVDAAGEIRAVVPDPLTYKGNINPTTEDGGADAIPTGSVGDAYTCSWGGTNVEGDLDNSPDWLSAIKGSDTTATLGDLLIINSGDGSGANEWTLVKTGTVDSGASIDVGDGTTASFPPASPQEGDVWYNTDDGRTYVYITDSSGDTVWVDISPQGNQTLWKKDSATDIEPQTNTDNLKIPNLAGGTSTAGTTIVMADTNGVVVSNAVGDGLEINNGKLRIRQSGGGSAINNLQFVCNAGNTTTTGATFNKDVNVGDGRDISNNINATGIRLAQDSAAAGCYVQCKGTADPAGQVAFLAHAGIDKNFEVAYDGSATFKGQVDADRKNANDAAFTAKQGGTTKAAIRADGTVVVGGPSPGTGNGNVRLNPSGDCRALKWGTQTTGGTQACIIASGEWYSATSNAASADGVIAYPSNLIIHDAGNNRDIAAFNSTFIGIADGTPFSAPNIELFTNGSANFAGDLTLDDSSATGTGRILFGGSQHTFIKGYDVGNHGSLAGIRIGDTTNGEKIQLRADGKIILNGTSVEGIQFGSTNSGGNITSQTLDDYEEGTFTPSLTTDGGISNAGPWTGTYSKVGRVVTIKAQNIQTSNNMELVAGLYRIDGLPFPSLTADAAICVTERNSAANVEGHPVSVSGASTATFTIQQNETLLRFLTITATYQTS